MRFGCCADLDSADIVQSAGFDYIELPVSVVKAELPDSEFEPVAQRLRALDIVPEVWNRLLPASIKITGPEIDSYRIERYLRTAFARIEELGGEVVVFGCGGSRNVPDGFSRDTAREQIIEFVTLAGKIAGTHGIVIAVEGQDSKSSNIITSVREAGDIVSAADHPFVRLLVDLHHMQEENEPLSHIKESEGAIAHAHISDASRAYPGSGNYPIAEFLRMLRTAGYEDRVSVESLWVDLESEAPKALKYLRGLDDRIPA